MFLLRICYTLVGVEFFISMVIKSSFFWDMTALLPRIENYFYTLFPFKFMPKTGLFVVNKHLNKLMLLLLLLQTKCDFRNLMIAIY
jgi:hypothetical protein